MIQRFVAIAILSTLPACGAEAPSESQDGEPHLVIASAREHVYADRSDEHGSGQFGYAWTFVGEGVGHFEATLHTIADGKRDSVVVRGESISVGSPRLTREVSLAFTDGNVVGNPGRIHAALAVVREGDSATSVDWGGPQEIETPHGVVTRWRRTDGAVPLDEEWVVLILGIEKLGSSGTPLPVPVTLANLTAQSSEGRILLVVSVRWKENP
jgi:hypothetical protein